MSGTGRPCPWCGHQSAATLWRSPDAVAGRCSSCGGTYLSGITGRAREIPQETYERIYSGDATISPLTRQSYLALLDRFAERRETGVVVDVGCGAGAFLAVAAERGWRAIGTETARGAGALALESGATVLVGDDPSRQLAGGCADVVTLFEVLEHVDDPVGLLRECRRLLRPGGLLYLTTPNHASLARRLTGPRWPRYHIEHLAYFDPRSLRRALESAGLRPTVVLTKNLDPFLIVSALSGAAGSSPDAPGPAGDRPAGPGRGVTWPERGREALRRLIKSGPAGRALAGAVNALMARYALGDSLVAEAERPGQRR